MININEYIENSKKNKVNSLDITKHIENVVKNFDVDKHLKDRELIIDKTFDLKIKIDNQNEKIDVLAKAGTLTLNDINEYEKLIREMNKLVKDNNIEEIYVNSLDTHKENLYNIKEEIAMTTNNIDILNELMKDKNHYIRCSIAENPNATEEMLRELSKEYENTEAIIKNPSTPIDLLEKYCLDKNDIEVYEIANKKLQERQQDNINNIENFLQNLNKEDIISSMANVNLNNNDSISNLNERINQVKQSLNDLSSDNKEIYTNKVLNAVSEFNKKILNKAMPEPEPEHNYDFER